MNMNIKNILIGLGIFGAGATAGYFVCKKTLTNHYLEEINANREFYAEKIKELGVMDEDFEPEETIDDYDDEDLESDDPDFIDEVESWEEEQEVKKLERISKIEKLERGKGRPIINYNKPPLHLILEQIESEQDEIEAEETRDEEYEADLEARADEFARRKHENRSNGEPYIIDYDEYMDGPEEYERRILYYYSKDRTLCEDDDSEIEDEEMTVGFDYEDVLDMQTIAWVRNDNLNVLYEIHRIDESYQDAVANRIETPREREFRIKGRQKQALDDR